MSQSQHSVADDSEAKPVLAASLHDVRYLVALLRGISFSNRATVTLTADGGMTVSVEESRTLVATSYIYPDHFDEWTYTPPPPPPKSASASATQATELTNDDDDEADTNTTTAFEVPLNTLIDCLGIYGTANLTSLASSSGGPKHRRWRRDGESGDEGDGDGGRRGGGGGGGGRGRRDEAPSNNSRIDAYFGAASNEKRTSARVSYGGPGYPLALLLAEDASGPTTTCEIATFDPEPGVDLPFDGERTVLKIIFKSSSWLRDALAELDPSCDKITFTCNPPAAAAANNAPQPQQPQQRGGGSTAKPLFRIQASGTFGSTEMDYPNDREVLETYECGAPLSATYRFGHIARTLRALQSSTKTSLRIDDAGLLSLQFLVPVPVPKPRGGSGGGGGGGTSNSFIEFRCLALDDGTSY
ncbi:Rad1-domain-containing protein [Coniophora puteana RWD-64-598 SS2]|uniref:Rad1-domain-containing protein n=1 Tax=Coniophora puteana (strain RWD-64-598) TaxID=741705 RepID=A0A5M3N294_CONPW|nr:Rad1-domain-containing protein [Coniophora puteana RWD-64-598 SS2]EIW85499.1 Rad1-domain-containing protein [Coniophora puteana RWD-64-598 SS2]